MPWLGGGGGIIGVAAGAGNWAFDRLRCPSYPLGIVGDGRRCPPGYYDGEHIFASAPPALVEFMMQQVHEIGVLLHWCKLEEAVALGGTSLGALAAKLMFLFLNKRLQLYPQPK